MSQDTAFEVGRLWLQLKRIADVLTAAQGDLFVRLPGLIAYWSGGTRATGGSMADHSGNSRLLTQVGVCPTGYDGNSYAHLGNGTNYFTQNGASFGVTGLETHIDPGIRGLTMGGWFAADVAPTADGLLSKSGTTTNYGYCLRWMASNQPNFFISANGASSTSVDGADLGALGEWHFIVARFKPNVELAVFTDSVKVTNATAIPASVNVSTEDFEIGRYSAADTTIFHGRARDVFVCAAALSDELIDDLRLSSSP